MKAVDTINNKIRLGPLLMMEMYDRLCPNTFEGRKDPEVKLLAKQSWDDAGYCIDAPELIPAGGCESTEVEEGVSYPAQITISRL